MARIKLPAHRLILIAALSVAAVLVAAGTAVGFQASERPGFCTTCHEMNPYHAAWEKGPHASVACVDCHVDPGLVAHVSHKVIAAQELWVHLTGDPRFPSKDAEVPNARCLRCHDAVGKPVATGFSHVKHAKAGTCVTCHSKTGHDVSLASLAAEGVLKTGATETLTPASRTSTPTTFSIASTIPPPAWAKATGAAAATSSLHANVSCTGCHDLDATACSACHSVTAKHAQRGQCSTCHVPGVRWAFSHPVGASCTGCHTAPAKHRSGTCTTCHPQKGRSWAFAHPASASCQSCHKAKHRPYGAGCANCHAPGTDFAKARVRHTSALACTGCHKAPRAHYGTRCVGCHRIGSRWANARVVHTARMSCSQCHSRKHRSYSASCSSCHRSAGRSWRFSHPASSSCTSCHRRPSSHYGSSCASCHRSRRTWAASIRHPSTGEHSWRSFACSKCHPSGYRTASCTCHGGRPPSGD